MQFFILVLILCFVTFLFVLFLQTKDDLVLIRNKISQEEIFNLAFSVAFSSLVFSRFFYVIFSHNFYFFNPLYFILFTHFPGLSLTGGVLGGVVSLFAFSRIFRMPFDKLFDSFAFSFLFSMPIGVLGYFGLSDKKILSIELAVAFIIYLVLIAIFARFISPAVSRGRLKTGGVGYIFISSFSLVSIIFNVVFHASLINLENSILMIMLLSSLIVFFGRVENASHRARF